MRYWIGNLVIVAMLFSHSALLWAKANATGHSHDVMQQDCHSKHAQSKPQQKHCQQDCCKDGKLCTAACLSCGVAVVVTVLPINVPTLLPHYRINSTVTILSAAPDGTDATIIYRPPQTAF